MRACFDRPVLSTLAILALTLGGCTHHDQTFDLVSGDIRSVLNLPGTNAPELDAAFDTTHEGVAIGAMQRGIADYGRGDVGRSASEPPVLVVSRYNAALSALWSTAISADFTASARPAMAVTQQDNIVVAIGDFNATDPGSMVELLSAADGSVRWSINPPATGAPRPVAAVAEPNSASFVVASAVDSGQADVRLDRLAELDGALITSRPLGLSTGNHQLSNLAVDADGNLLATGTFDGSLVLAATYTAIAGEHAAYVTKIGRDSGAALWSRPLRRRSADDRVVVAPLANGDVGVVGVFAFADDATDTDNPLGPTLYLRAARLSGTNGETVWTTRTTLPNTATLEIVDLADGASNLVLLATFSGTLQIAGITAVSTTASTMAMLDFSVDDGSTSWLRYSSTVAARGHRVGQDLSGDALGIGTFTAKNAEDTDIATIFAIRVVP